MTTPDTPGRVVDPHGQGWYLADGGKYEASFGFNRDLPGRTYDDLIATRGPLLRPVLPITDDDDARFRELFATARRRTVTTLAAAIEQTFHRLVENAHRLGAGQSWEVAKRTLTAGREGSWESSVLIDVACFGNGLNMAAPRKGIADDVMTLRARGPARRVHKETRDAMADILYRWVTDPARYTEVAATLAYLVSSYADGQTAYPHDGWRAVADQWLQPNSLARDDFVTCYRLLYSTSANFDAGLI